MKARPYCQSNSYQKCLVLYSEEWNEVCFPTREDIQSSENSLQKVVLFFHKGHTQPMDHEFLVVVFDADSTNLSAPQSLMHQVILQSYDFHILILHFGEQPDTLHPNKVKDPEIRKMILLL